MYPSCTLATFVRRGVRGAIVSWHAWPRFIDSVSIISLPLMPKATDPPASRRSTSKKENADVAASNVGVFASPGGYRYATSWIPPCRRQGAHLLNGRTLVMLQQPRERQGRCHVGCLPGYIHTCRVHALAGVIRLTNP